MAGIPRSIQNLIEEFGKLPGVGPKTASRLTFFLLNKPESEVDRLAEAVGNLRKNLKICEQCFNIAEENPCDICSDQKRNRQKICMVEEPLDVMAIERTGYDGLYHILGGVISPINGIGPEELRISQLLQRVQKEEIAEVILATDPSLEGEATAMFVNQKISNLKLQTKDSAIGNQNLKKLIVTRIARGLPVGGDLEYADEMTLRGALEGRKEY